MKPDRPPDNHRLLAYVADLELEVDRLRKQTGFLRHEFGEALRPVAAHCAAADDGVETRAAAVAAVGRLTDMLRDLRDSPEYHPAYDQVVAVAVRPLVEKVFRWQQVMTGCKAVDLRLDLTTDHVEWFPARLRNILENALSNALRYRDPRQSEPWVRVSVRATDDEYEIRVADNGTGMPEGQSDFHLLLRAAPLRDAGPGVGLAVVRVLLRQSGGTLHVRSEDGGGTELILTLPRYEMNDFLT